MSQKWKLIPQYIQELQEQNDENSMAVLRKLGKLQSLKECVDRDESELKKQYILLMRERNEYFKKLKAIQQINEQNPNSQLAQSIQLLFDAINKQQ
ncbi:unnamed protein product (macronuclear) [Paramecium tetraurelia]|uniref:EB1 C-terminal domain-containing protein n=1 Tax=Paramecium tetraurelia TaxID=5888 RepID=A0BB05_PARTE|nr:uncharacterized protein GSPATT00000157001 [Paramecium tetraurelia]CAK55722.1 unnamed protein product [Paramecium tetraurelia]|eukprot:XP_001423120.1 hypothetical protein (macronuclear) [Paramecium tetraurelia strain d4-2]